MKIAFLHLNMGLVDRGSEISTHIIATKLSVNHQVLVLGSGSITNHKYQYKKISGISQNPKAAPTDIISKLLFRLYLDKQSKLIKSFTRKSISELQKFNPDIIIPTNGKPQIKIIKKHFPSTKIAIFGRAGIGWNDKDNLRTKPDLFISLSKKAKHWAEEIKNKNTKVVYIPNPIELSHFIKSKPKKINLNKPIIITVGALTKYKNIDLVIKAVAKTRASLIVLGKGEEEKYLKKLAQKLIPNRYIFSHSPYLDLPKYLKAADVFCFMPDLQEAFGRVYIEAMASSLPIVAPHDAIRRDIIGKSGFYSSYRVSTIATNIKKALKSKKVNYNDKLKKYSSDVVVSSIENQLRLLLK